MTPKVVIPMDLTMEIRTVGYWELMMARYYPKVTDCLASLTVTKETRYYCWTSDNNLHRVRRLPIYRCRRNVLRIHKSQPEWASVRRSFRWTSLPA